MTGDDNLEQYLDEEPKDVLDDWWDELFDSGDRGCAISGQAYLEQLVEVMLRKYLRDLPKGNRDLVGHHSPLSGFAHQIDAAYSMGLISKRDWKNLDYIRRIRNEFAHTPGGLSFSSEAIAERCRHLRIVDDDGDAGPTFDDPRKQFQWTTVAVGLALSIRAEYLDSVSAEPAMSELVAQAVQEMLENVGESTKVVEEF